MSDITIESSDETGYFSAYIAMPEKTPAPAIILIQEIFGVNVEMRKKCDELAEKGFIAICPDLFWRLEPGVQLTDKTEEEWQKAFDLFNRFDLYKGVEDLITTLTHVRSHSHCNGKVGCVGYCLGGKLAYLMAARSDVNASVGYYGVGLDEHLEEAETIQSPLMLHIAEEDKFVSSAQQETIKTALNEYQSITIYSYPGVDHAFARGNGEHYDEQAATLANARTLDFLTNNLELALAA